MPIVLVQNDRTVGGRYDSWEDSTGETYHYPNQYRNLVVPGEPFIYYRGVRAPGSKRRSEPEYFGCGIVRSVWRDESIPAERPKRTWKWYCSLTDYTAFQQPVSWKVQDQRIEQIPQNLFGNGVRRISAEVYRQILDRAGVLVEDMADVETLGDAQDLGEIAGPTRALVTVQRVIRDTALARRLKALHRDECQICGTVVHLGSGRTYSEAHHLRPLGRPHNGPDIEGNIVVLCPTHHVLCDYGALQLCVGDLRQANGHAIAKRFVRYHNEVITTLGRERSATT